MEIAQETAKFGRIVKVKINAYRGILSNMLFMHIEDKDAKVLGERASCI